MANSISVPREGHWSLSANVLFYLLIVAILSISNATAAEPKWQTLPDTPELPETTQKGFVTVDGARIWYAAYGSGDPVIMLHGGLANSNYWGHQVRELAKSFRVIVMDSRGHGRSTRDNRPLTYDLMASDVIALMKHLNASKAAIIGWSDGAIIGLKLAISNPDQLSGLFAFGANSHPSGLYDLSDSRIFERYLKRAREEYETLSSTPGEYDDFYVRCRQCGPHSRTLPRKICAALQFLSGLQTATTRKSSGVRTHYSSPTAFRLPVSYSNPKSAIFLSCRIRISSPRTFFAFCRREASARRRVLTPAHVAPIDPLSDPRRTHQDLCLPSS